MYAYVSLPSHRAARASLLRRAELSEPPCIPLPSPCGALAAIARRSRVPRGALPAAAWSYPDRRTSLLAAARSYPGGRASLPAAARSYLGRRASLPAAARSSRPPRVALLAAVGNSPGRRASLPCRREELSRPPYLAGDEPSPTPGPRVTCDVLRHGGWSCACSPVNYG